MRGRHTQFKTEIGKVSPDLCGKKADRYGCVDGIGRCQRSGYGFDKDRQYETDSDKSGTVDVRLLEIGEMGAKRRRIVWALGLVVGITCVAGAGQPGFTITEQMRTEAKIKQELMKAVLSWLSDGNVRAGDECDRLVHALLTTGEPSVHACFMGAQVANLRGKPLEAISAIEGAIEKYPDERAPVGLRVPTKVWGCFWIANLAKESGDMARAKRVYEDLLSTLKDMQTSDVATYKTESIMTCELLLAEMEREHGQGKQKALSYLKAAEDAGEAGGARRAGIALRQSWVRYESTRATKGSAVANAELPPVSDAFPAYELAAHHLFLTGISGSPLAGYVKGMNVVTKILVDRTVEGKHSQVDRDLARLGYGYDQHHKGNLEEAEKYFASLFEDDSFFSPVAGISLARVKKAQQDTGEARAVLDRVQSKYPSYDSVVTEIRRSWE